MLALIERLWNSAPAWAKGLVIVLLAAGWVWTQVQAHWADKERANLLEYSKSIAVTVDQNASASTNPASQPSYVEQNLPVGWDASKKESK